MAKSASSKSEAAGKMTEVTTHTHTHTHHIRHEHLWGQRSSPRSRSCGVATPASSSRRDEADNDTHTHAMIHTRYTHTRYTHTRNDTHRIHTHTIHTHTIHTHTIHTHTQSHAQETCANLRVESVSPKLESAGEMLEIMAVLHRSSKVRLLLNWLYTISIGHTFETSIFEWSEKMSVLSRDSPHLAWRATELAVESRRRDSFN